ncbi:MAG TPA: dihydropteroate synthase [Phycisphaerae bacterium]|nr:dihydropteroate synthase [Phycisphaerae bacterium]
MGITLDDILTSHRTGRSIVMGILNVTPDSFSDGGAFLDPADAKAQAERLVAEGADAIDVGAESTRPGSERVSAGEQIDRLREILPAVVACGAVVSIDTTRAEVAAFALDAGAQILNDVSAGRDDPGLFALAAERGAPMILMHMLGEPKSMQADPQYDDVVSEVRAFLAERIGAAGAAGVARRRLIVDPGIGFGKRLEHNLALLAGVGELASLGTAVLIGPSRKRFLGELTGRRDPRQRLAGTLAACLAARRGGATIFRVHDVAPLREALAVAEAIEPLGE